MSVGGENLKHWHPLAKLLVKGTKQVKFTFDEMEFVFALSVFNTQAMEMGSTTWA